VTLCSLGLLSIAKTLDRETTEVFRLNISATDGGQPLHATYAALTVHVIDVNDNPPVFERSVYVVNVSEGVKLGSVVTTVHAVDKDTGKQKHTCHRSLGWVNVGLIFTCRKGSTTSTHLSPS